MSHVSRRKRDMLPAQRQPRASRRTRARSPAVARSPAQAPRATEHPHVLYAIESTLINCYHDDARVDDAVALTTLRSMVLRDPPCTLPHAWVFSKLALIREAFPEVPGEDWDHCVRTVLDAVRRQSFLTWGDTRYLDQVSRCVA